MTAWSISHQPDRCPFGHELGPGQASLSYDTTTKAHWLLCGGCNRHSQIPLVDGGEWQVYTPASGWAPFVG